VRFDAMVPPEPLKLATKHAKKADVALVLGSSMTVRPFCELPMGAKHVVIVTLQDTQYDECDNVLKINAYTDQVMRGLLQELGMETDLLYAYVQSFVFGHRRLQEQNRWMLFAKGGRTNEPVTCLEAVMISTKPDASETEMEQTKEGFEAQVSVRQQAELTVRFIPRKEHNADAIEIVYAMEGEEGQRRLEFRKEGRYLGDNVGGYGSAGIDE